MVIHNQSVALSIIVIGIITSRFVAGKMFSNVYARKTSENGFLLFAYE